MTEKSFKDDLLDLIGRAEKLEITHSSMHARMEIYLWDILTSLRGPDSEHFQLKALTTARLRAIVFPNTDIGMAFRKPLHEFELKERDKLLFGDLNEEESDALGASTHFSYHFQGAMEAAKALGYDVPEAELHFEHNIPIPEDEEEYEFNTDDDTPNKEEE
jgi:hypothetical protein